MTVARSQSEALQQAHMTPQTGCPWVLKLSLVSTYSALLTLLTFYRINLADGCAAGTQTQGRPSECADSCL